MQLITKAGLQSRVEGSGIARVWALEIGTREAHKIGIVQWLALKALYSSLCTNIILQHSYMLKYGML